MPILSKAAQPLTFLHVTNRSSRVALLPGLSSRTRLTRQNGRTARRLTRGARVAPVANRARMVGADAAIAKRDLAAAAAA